MQPGMQCSANGNAEGPTSEVSPQQRDAPSMLGDDVSGDEHHAAAVIQRAWRRIAVRKRERPANRTGVMPVLSCLTALYPFGCSMPG